MLRNVFYKLLCCGLLSPFLAGCTSSTKVRANAADPTPPTALWVQSETSGRPLVNVYLNEGPVAGEIGSTEQATVTARADDPDGGVKSIRLLTRSRRPRAGGSALPSFAIAAANNSSASPGDQVDPSASVSITVSASTLAGGSWEGGLEVMAEAENFAGQVVRTPVLSLCIEKVRLFVHVIPLSDDDGGHAPNVTPAEFADALQRANRVFCGTGIQFAFDPASAWEPMNNTEMNQDRTIYANGNSFADARPKRVLLLLRWGSDLSNHTGNGNAYPPAGPTPPRNFSDVDQRYVALPSFYSGGNSLTIQNGSFLAHELGHYLGLYHTFPGWDGVVPAYGVNPTTANQADQALVAYVRSNGGTIDALDGDGLSDTPPDPNVILYQRHNMQNPCVTPRITISGQVGGNPYSYQFLPEVMNAMAYYDICDNASDPRPRDFTPGQVQVMHATLARAPRNRLVAP